MLEVSNSRSASGGVAAATFVSWEFWQPGNCQGAVQHRRLVPVAGSRWNEARDEQGPLAIQARPLGPTESEFRSEGAVVPAAVALQDVATVPVLSVGFAVTAHSPTHVWKPLDAWNPEDL